MRSTKNIAKESNVHDESSFYEKSNTLVIFAKDDTKIIAYQEGGDASLEGKTSHNSQPKEDELANDATTSDVPEEIIMS